MPEIAEVARAVHYIHKHLVGKTLKTVTAIEDNNVFGKVGTSHTEIMKHLTGKKVVDAGQQGKYFWMIMSSPPHPVMHFGMAGWLEFRSEHTYYYRPKSSAKKDEWPPKHTRFHMVTEGEGDKKIEAAFVDLRRFGRVRLVDCPGKEIRNYSPLVENGPDPVVDKDKVTFQWLKELCQKKKLPIKAMLLDQGNISGIGNWVGDEIMYNAKVHPEQYSNTLSEDQIKRIHKSIHYVCGTACELLGDSEQFPKDWLFKHRWGKGKKDGTKTLPNGEKIVFLTVGGRTSAVVPSVQKKTGPVAKDISEADEEEKPKKGKSNKRVKEEESEDEDEPPAKKTTAKKDVQTNGTSKTTKATKASATSQVKTAKAEKVTEVKMEPKTPKRATPAAAEANETGRRRSGRNK